MDWPSTFLPVVHLLLGPLLYLIAKVFQLWPPKRINYIYGYRTRRSMRNQCIWEEAQRYSAHLLEYAALFTIAFQVVATRLWRGEKALLYSVIFMVLVLLGAIVATENHLKKTFDDEDQ